ncbi:MAG: DNA methylase [Candidatus Lambdaproteobacteria bacterium RIFOXYD1_FULL_56_27]|uniref:site-specific DNA-methyltransferase (adenine-specific) n=1 Tax=Candidatus Lambdaproteobacteria bacterium RIFOXYD2_FULL_56_26 TaxID=1817773 RepID=A0A1F6GQ95_9PROT|nr:MAG: DNA methylase [Candidatus Lambdaproteobacteria bacterium RIFOXYD2_FULL_56_26]OGH04100.1 MAG: DNA methylase [Candidatus Lambdaproteobacteria bacterium RIFOXYC1_FULL_56_13]OGH06383.1 MAG: DNA methylase [Candidatus Lambdaproteobacteria bacterium RIFOXYD1_FULL_56_27]
MAKKGSKKTEKLQVEAFTHEEASRKNIPTAEYQSVMKKADQGVKTLRYPRNPDLDPQLVWRGKDAQDQADLAVAAPPIYIQEKVHPKALIDDLKRQSQADLEPDNEQVDIFADFNGIPKGADKTDFYRHDQNWTNRMILGDSLQAMASLAEREGLRGKVQCIYFDPPYGIKFNSNFQWSTTSRDVKDGAKDHITREPEQVKAFRDTWRDGIHSYLTYLRDRLTVARDLLTESGSIFVQIGDENVHRVRAVMDEVFGDENFISQIVYRTTTGKASEALDNTCDFILWFAKCKDKTKFRRLLFKRDAEADRNFRFDFSEDGLFGVAGKEPHRISRMNPITSQSGSTTTTFEYPYSGRRFVPGKGGWKTNFSGMERLKKSQRLTYSGLTLGFVRPFIDFGFQTFSDVWDDTRQSGFGDSKLYVVQTTTRVIERCILLTTDPGDLVLDPTCGSGTTAYVAEQWGRRWITLDTSRVALALARARIMGARYPFYLLADSREGQQKEAVLTQVPPSESPTHGDLRHGFVYERVPHVTLKSIANNTEIDVIWDRFQEVLEPLRTQLNQALGQKWEEWEVPREAGAKWSKTALETHAKWWENRLARQREIDASIAAKAESEYLYDKPYEDKKKVRVAGPFTVESLSPHRAMGVDENDELIDPLQAAQRQTDAELGFVPMILENLKTAGVQQAHKEDKITFTSLTPWPGHYICAEGRYEEGETEKRAAIFIGPEFGTVARGDLVAAAREAGDAGFEVLVACAFNYDAHSSEFNSLGRIPILKARMNADLHMAEDLKNTGKGNLFVIFGEPDLEILEAPAGQIIVKLNGVDVFHPATGKVQSDGPEGIACWFIDTDYNEESFFVRQAYFLGANDPYKALKTTLKAEINEEAWASLNRSQSRPFPKPTSHRIAVKVINHLGDEVMKVFKV